MPKYFYKCPKCGHEYLEQRTVEEPQYFTKCNGCGDAEYIEVTPNV